MSIFDERSEERTRNGERADSNLRSRSVTTAASISSMLSDHLECDIGRMSILTASECVKIFDGQVGSFALAGKNIAQ